ncbi:MAG: type II secretion system protein [Methylobacter sp.]
MPGLQKRMAGFTLIEAIIVMVITGILGALVASFAAPLRGYFDAAARADLSDVADTALRRMARELHAALPNSVRVSGGYIEFLPTITGGRYRAGPASSGTVQCGGTLAQDILDFTAADTCFEVIGGLPAAPAAGEEIVIYNTTPGAVYAGDNVAEIAAGSTTGSIMFASKQFPFESPGIAGESKPSGQRFQVIGKPVTYACSGATLWRYSGYARQPVQPASIAVLDGLAGAVKARLATGVNCADSRFVYTPGVTNRAGLVTMSLTLSNSSDSVTLLHQVHVQNVP